MADSEASFMLLIWLNENVRFFTISKILTEGLPHPPYWPPI